MSSTVFPVITDSSPDCPVLLRPGDTHAHTYVHCAHAHTHAHMHCVHAHVRVHTRACTQCLHVCVYTYICMCTYIYMCTHTLAQMLFQDPDSSPLRTWSSASPHPPPASTPLFSTVAYRRVRLTCTLSDSPSFDLPVLRLTGRSLIASRFCQHLPEEAPPQKLPVSGSWRFDHLVSRSFQQPCHCWLSSLAAWPCPPPHHHQSLPLRQL